MFYHFLKFSHLLNVSYFFESSFLHRIRWLNGRSFYVFGTLESNPKQFTFILMYNIFINKDCKAVYKILMQWVCNYVQSAKAIVERFQCRNAGLVGYIVIIFLNSFLSFFFRMQRIQVFLIRRTKQNKIKQKKTKMPFTLQRELTLKLIISF